MGTIIVATFCLCWRFKRSFFFLEKRGTAQNTLARLRSASSGPKQVSANLSIFRSTASTIKAGRGALLCSRRRLVNSFRRPTRLTRRHHNVLCIRGLSVSKSSARHLAARAVRRLWNPTHSSKQHSQYLAKVCWTLDGENDRSLANAWPSSRWLHTWLPGLPCWGFWSQREKGLYF